MLTHRPQMLRTQVYKNPRAMGNVLYHHSGGDAAQAGVTITPTSEPGVA